jgi:hypothetical protein
VARELAADDVVVTPNGYQLTGYTPLEESWVD